MLVLSRKKNESIVINNDVTIVVVDIRGDKVRLGVEAPASVPVHRREVYDAIKRNEEAAREDDDSPPPSVGGAEPKDALVVAERFKGHPLVESYVTAIRATMSLTKLASDEQQLRQQLLALCAYLQEDPSYGVSEVDITSRYCEELLWPSTPTVRETEVERAFQCISQQESLVLVGDRGSGRRSVASHLARTTFLDSTSGSSVIPTRLLVPNQAALNTDGYSELLERVLENMCAERHDVLVLPDIHQLARAPGIAESWSRALSVVFAANLPVVTWTTPNGCDTVRNVWPSLFDHCKVLQLPAMSRSQIGKVIEYQISARARTWGLQFDEGFRDALLDNADRWGACSMIAEPARSLELLDAIVEFANARPGSHNAYTNTFAKLIHSAVKLATRATRQRDDRLQRNAQRELSQLKKEALRSRPRQERRVTVETVHQFFGGIEESGA